MASISANGVQLGYDLHGTEGDPVVLVHGSYVDRRTWSRVVPGFSQGLQVLAYDRRGYGESTVRPQSHPVRDDAADLAALLAALDHYPAHVIAHSYGGTVALRLAVERPEMVRSLALHEVPLIGLLADDPATAPEAERMVAGVREMRDSIGAGRRAEAAERLVDLFSKEPGAWGRLAPSVRASFVGYADRWAEEYGDPEALRPDALEMRELLVPTLLTQGSESPAFLHRITRRLESALRNSKVQELPGAGHSPHVTRPDQYVGLLVGFLLERNVPVT